MIMKTWILQNASHPLDERVIEALRAEKIDFDELPLPDNHEDIQEVLAGKAGGAVLMPAIWEDLFSVKLTEEINTLDGIYKTVLAGEAPRVSNLVVAFNEGITAFLELPLAAGRLRQIMNRVRDRHNESVRFAQRLFEAESAKLPLPLLSGMINRDHLLGQALLQIREQKGPCFDGSIRVLVVSSSKSQQKQLAGVLQRMGLKVDLAGSMAEAVKRVQNEAFTALVSDNMLPDGDALTLASALLKSPLKAMPYFIVWSASPDKAAHLLDPGTHIDGVILKPGPDTGIESVLPTILAAVYYTLD
jgi:DNA-binding NtrC family response regulator